MATIEIPRRFQHVCDCCGVSEIDDGEPRPEHWMTLTAEARGISYAGKTITKLLCPSCGEATLQSIERVEPRKG